MYPPSTQAASFIPSEDEVIALHGLLPAPVLSVHVAPPSVDVTMGPPPQAASVVPSEDEVISLQGLLPAPVLSIHVTPPSVEV